ncbi:Transcriptional regulator, ArsR family [uncultured Sphingopyxis sp.]|uniref:Transcriptional regulator, ArsR family n=2 Tax=uncultured Sphingopyxis sp. TaxID=310581 RepID=A0A1Y5PUF7_9SPHN|nr:Transcriptional regulator, ArsR family [uncultured Sphingopyxis sp.]
MVHHMANQTQSLDSVFHALADPTRRAVISRLLDGAAPVKRLSEPFQMGLPAFLKHLSVLEASGLIHTEKHGRVRNCRIDAARLAAAEGWLAEQRAIWQGRTDRLAAFVESQHPPEEPT